MSEHRRIFGTRARHAVAAAALVVTLGSAERATAATPLVDPQRTAVASSFDLEPECIEGSASTVDPSFVTVNMSYADGCGYDAPFLGSVLRSRDDGRTYERVIDLPERPLCPVEGVPTPVALDLRACDDPMSLPPVLGQLGFYGQYGDGWGKARPRALSNGGAPSGTARSIRWRNWGSSVATGRGLTPLYRPGGGYYRRQGRIILRASRLGTCPDTGALRTYTRLTARAQVKPGGRYGRWFRWGGNEDLCGSYFD